jgi:ATP-binding cassette, subfamily B (MDR/TAP), member 1
VQSAVAVGYFPSPVSLKNLLLTVLTAAAPIQAYLFACLVSLFSLLSSLEYLGILINFWCLMFAVLAIGVGLSYFALAWASTSTSFNITHYYRHEYVTNMLTKPISFYDHEDHSVGALTARLAMDPLQLQQLLGMNMAFVIISFLNVIGCLTISFIFGWKLTAVTALTSIPIIVGAAFFRVRYERRFEQMSNAVFAESAKFATESIGAFRTVSALTLEDTITSRYATLLHAHIKKAFAKNAVSTFLFALSDSIALLCMAFVLWYGGKLMAQQEYWPFQYGKLAVQTLCLR